MSASNRTLALWETLSAMPGGKWLFSRLACLRAPYFGTIRPMFEELRAGYCELRMNKRRAVLNHIGTVHAIAMCNLAELAGGAMMEVSLPATHRWIPRGMTVQYLKKAQSDLHAVAELACVPQLTGPAELPVVVHVIDASGGAVLRAVLAMWVTPAR